MGLLVGGIDGGASRTTMVLFDNSGNQLALVNGPSTNHWVIGLAETTQRLLRLVDSALRNAGLSPDTKVDHLCLALSGVDTEANRRSLLDGLKAAKPDLAGTVRLCNDSVGTSMAATDGDSVVLISGTGSICNYVRRDLTETRLGGYGYLLGDNGSAFWIAMRVINSFLEIHDGTLTWQHSLDRVREIIYSYFDIKDPLGLLPHFYQSFCKTKIAKLCERLATAAESGEPLCSDVFHRAGAELGRYARAGARLAVKDMKTSASEITVICCGSVFNSWHLLKSGFREALQAEPFGWRGNLNLVCLRLPAAFGSARIAARLGAGIELPIAENAVQVLDTIPVGG